MVCELEGVYKTGSYDQEEDVWDPLKNCNVHVVSIKKNKEKLNNAFKP